MTKLQVILLTLALFIGGFANAQNHDSIPSYSAFLQELNDGNLDIDYRTFRISYIYSAEFKSKYASEYQTLKQKVYNCIEKKEYDEILRLCNLMLEIDYTSMFAHKYIQQTAKITGDSSLYKKHHHIEFGLLKSIVHNGDGKSCATSWEVTQLEEEYFILSMLGAKLKKQVLEGGCDKMIVRQKGRRKTHYFGVYYIFLSRRL